MSPRSRFRVPFDDDGFEPDTEPDRSPTGERPDSGWSRVDREAAADREAQRYESWLLGPNP